MKRGIFRYALYTAAAMAAVLGLAAAVRGPDYVLDLYDEWAERYRIWTVTQGVPPFVLSVVDVQAKFTGEPSELNRRNGSGVVLSSLYIESQKVWHTYILAAGHVVTRREPAGGMERKTPVLKQPYSACPPRT